MSDTKPQRHAERQRWEYLERKDPSPDEMNALGRDGWELVVLTVYSNGGFFHFKRRLIDGEVPL